MKWWTSVFILFVLALLGPSAESVAAPECTNSEAAWMGNILIVPQSLRSFGKQDQDYLKELPTSAAARYAAGIGSQSRVLPFVIADLSGEEAFKALAEYVSKGSVPGNKLVINMNVPPQNSQDSIYQQLDATNLRRILSGSTDFKVSDKWSLKGKDGSDRIFIRMDLKNATVVIGASVKTSCITEDQEVEESPTTQYDDEGLEFNEDHAPQVDEDNQDRPEDGSKPFIYPLSEQFEGRSSYFFGPRLFQSWPLVPRLYSTSNEPIELSVSSRKGVLKDARQILKKNWDAHPGVDLVGSSPGLIAGQNVINPFDGVIYSQIYHKGCGNTLIIRHEFNDGGRKLIVYTRYLHLKSFAGLKVGLPVKRGQVVAKVGNTGTFAGGTYHLHFEVRVPRALDVKVGGKDSSKSRFAAVFLQTRSVNSADYIDLIDKQCRERKSLEFKNAGRVATNRLGPLTAGFCSQEFERQLKNHPKIYKVKQISDIPKVFPPQKS